MYRDVTGFVLRKEDGNKYVGLNYGILWQIWKSGSHLFCERNY